MFTDRQRLYRLIEAKRKSRVIAFVTGDRPNQEAQIAKDAVDLFGLVLDELRNPKKISLLLYTQGGDTLAAWSLVNLLREFCDDLEVIIPSKCYSSGTLVCLGANRIVMAKQASLGPIDPSVNGPLNPEIPGAPQNRRMPLSVEDVAGYMDLATAEGTVPSEGLASVFVKLASEVHPLALGRVKRARSQIQDLAKKLLARHMQDTKAITKITNVLCKDAGSHDYSIYRTEARRQLGLSIETPSMPLYKNMRDILTDIRDEMQLSTPFNPMAMVSQNNPQVVPYRALRVVIETATNGGYHYVTEGNLVPLTDPHGNFAIRNEIKSDGWVKVP